MTSRDVKASYDKIVFPPPGVISFRKGAYHVVEAIEAPDPLTVRFRLKWPEASFLVNVASPFNWIYKADILARDVHWYETNVMGTGPFKFVEHVKGSHLVGRRTPTTGTRASRIDGYRAIFISSPRPGAASRQAAHQFAASPRRTATAWSGRSARNHRQEARGTACS
jgi:peptide/nickel transport system substrate-binding protein